MRRRIGHSSAATGRTPDAGLTGKRQQPIPPAVLTVKPQKTARENSAIQETTEFFFNESRDRTVALLLSDEERFQFSGDDLIEHGRFGIARAVSDARSHEGVQSSKPAPKSRRHPLSNFRADRQN
jgi:hypothetical protein